MKDGYRRTTSDVCYRVTGAKSRWLRRVDGVAIYPGAFCIVIESINETEDREPGSLVKCSVVGGRIRKPVDLNDVWRTRTSVERAARSDKRSVGERQRVYARPADKRRQH